MSSWWIPPLSIVESPSGSPFMALLLKSILSDMSIATPAFFFSCSFVSKIYFQPFTFSQCRSSVLRWVSCRQHMCGSCFLIPSAILCLLIGAFNPFTFKVIIDRYLFVAIFCTCVPLSFTVSIPVLKANLLTSLAELVLNTYIVGGFFCLGVYLFGFPF